MIYVCDVFAPGMLNSLVEGNTIEIGKRSNNIKEVLESLPESYKLCVTNKAILRTLRFNEVNLEGAEIMGDGKKIYPIPGDTLYIINPSESIIQYKNDITLPDNIVLRLDQINIK